MLSDGSVQYRAKGHTPCTIVVEVGEMLMHVGIAVYSEVTYIAGRIGLQQKT